MQSTTTAQQAKTNNGAGRWKEQIGFKPDINQAHVARTLRERRETSFFRHLTIEHEIRICVRYLSDEDYRLSNIASEIRTRPANLRQMFVEYGIDVRERRLTGGMSKPQAGK